jgi:hypothetical protein
LLEATSPPFVLVASMLEGICVAKEFTRAGDGERAVSVEVDAENRSVLDC